MNENPIKVFITYSWEDITHKKWARQLADDLLAHGIDTTIDQYDIGPEKRLPQFMEESITNATYVLVICTPRYKQKSDDRDGGVGYESHLMAGELLTKKNEHKFIPILRRGTYENAIPSFLIGKWAYDLSESLNTPEYEENLHEMISMLKGERRKPIIATTSEKRATVEDLACATIHATIDEYYEDDHSFKVILYDYDSHKSEDIMRLAVGDIIIVGGSTYIVKEITNTEYDGEIKVIMEDNTEVIFTEGTSGNMLALSPDDDRLFMHVYSILYLKVAPDIVYEDDSDPDNWDKPECDRVIVIKDLNEILKIKEKKEMYGIGFNFYATTITLNDRLEISKIHQDYDVAQ